MSRLAITLLILCFAGTAQAQIDDEPVNNTSSDPTRIQSADGTGIQSADGTGIRSADGTGMRSADGTGQRYTVQEGDTLGTIAKQFLGDASQWQQIFDANREVLSDANVVHTGAVLTIPASAGAD